MSALRKAMESLPLRSRRALALRFGAGLEWREMAMALDDSPLLVAAHTQAAVTSLRTALAHDWPVAGPDFVTPDNIEEAICSGAPVPSGLRERILRRVELYDLRLKGGRPSFNGRLRAFLLRFKHAIT